MTVCTIAGCNQDDTRVVETVRDMGDQFIHDLVTVCTSHGEMFDERGNELALSPFDVLIERPDRKPGDWCLICQDSCAVGRPGVAEAHEGGAE